MNARLILTLAAALLILRLPSLVQPMGADQGLYAYIGDRILAGELPYRDAWDQKPPAIHYTYAAMRLVWPGDGAVAAADLAAAGIVAWLLMRLGTMAASQTVGAGSALLFLLLSNPSFTRLAGVRLRAQCETFIAVAVTGALVLLAMRRSDGRRWLVLASGVLFGVAFTFKYNAGIYAVAGVAALWLWGRLTAPDVFRMAAGVCLPVALMLAVFAAGGALRDLFGATIAYNLRYSGETYAGPLDIVRYLITFPIERASVDALWTVGGAGCLILIPSALRQPARLIAPIWVAAACVSIAVNGSRGLPQYFVQANPALALAAAWGGTVAWSAVRGRFRDAAPWAGVAAALLIAIAVWRVNQFPKLVDQTVFDAQYALGRISASDYLHRYEDGRKYSAADASELAAFLRAHSEPAERVYVFGFTPAAYVLAGRVSASRFFWSRPVIVGFEQGTPGYGADGLLADLERTQPAVVALQKKDWAPDVADSADFFMQTPILASWLRSHYDQAAGPDAFDVWLRRSAVP
jgi:hypothetical protein